MNKYQFITGSVELIDCINDNNVGVKVDLIKDMDIDLYIEKSIIRFFNILLKRKSTLVGLR